MDYKKLTDKYFLRAKKILELEKINPIVRYQVFCRKDMIMPNIENELSFLNDNSSYGVGSCYINEGIKVKSGEPFLKYTGTAQDLIDKETVLLGKLSSKLTGGLEYKDFKEMEKNAIDIVDVAGDKPVYYFGARHFDPKYDSQIAQICKEAGFAGTSTDNGAKHFNSNGLGTIPHALILVVLANMIEEEDFISNPTVKATEYFDKHMPKDIPRIALIDTFNRELSDSIEVVDKIKSLSGVRIDTCGENHSQCIRCVNPPMEYMHGKGVTIQAVHNLRSVLPEDIKITVSSGFNAKKTKAFMDIDEKHMDKKNMPLFDSIGTGSLLPRVTMVTSDIISYHSYRREECLPLSKVGRNERSCNW